MARHVFHWKHGWIPLDHTAISHGGHPSQAKAGSPIRDRANLARAILSLPAIKDTGERHHASMRTVAAARHMGATHMLPPKLKALEQRSPTLGATQIEAFKGTSAEAHLEPDGFGGLRFTAERHALHRRIVEDTLKGTTPVEHPTYNVLGGGPASGKSTVVAANPELSRNTATINPDDVRLKLPEYGTQPPATRSSFTHEEASYIAKTATSEGFSRRLNLTLDGTGDSSPDSLHGKINAARDHGYAVHGYYVTIPTDDAVQRANTRAERTGRWVPETVIRNTHANVSHTLPLTMDKFDTVQVFDNSGSKGSSTPIASQTIGQPLQVLDPALWQAFLDKAQPTG